MFLLFALAALQAAPQTTPQAAPAPIEAPASSQWQAFSRSATIIYLVDVAQITTDGDQTLIRMARVRRQGTDQSHSVETVAFRCAANQTRSLETVQYGADGSESDRFSEGGDWETAPDRSLTGDLKKMACDNIRATSPKFDSIRAYIDAGRP